MYLWGLESFFTDFMKKIYGCQDKFWQMLRKFDIVVEQTHV